MAADSIYAEPPCIDDLAICSFYHRMELPGHGVVGDQWDLRDSVDRYLGQIDFAGKRVLDIGAASGYLSFEMERRGAEVISFDMRSGHDWNVVPHAHEQHYLPTIFEECDAAHLALRNAYWFAHRHLDSGCRAYYGDIYNLPAELGNFDIVFFGMVLGHLRDPFLALYSASRLCSGQVVVTNPSSAREPWWWKLPFAGSRQRQGIAGFMPTVRNASRKYWWALSDRCISQMLEVLGFETEATMTCRPQCMVDGRPRREKCRTTVTRRVRGRSFGVKAPQARRDAA